MKYKFELYCKDIENVENYEKAKVDNFKGWDCHHRLETWTSDGNRREVDLSMGELKARGMYYNRPANELIFLTRSEHSALHMKGRHFSEEHKKKMSEAAKNMSDEAKKKMSEAWDYDKHFTEETRNKISAALTGRHWYNNGVICVWVKECPEGFVPGRLR